MGNKIRWKGKKKILDKLSSCHISVSADGKRIPIAGGEIPIKWHFVPHIREYSWSFQWSPYGKKIAVSNGKTLRVINADGTGHKIILKR